MALLKHLLVACSFATLGVGASLVSGQSPPNPSTELAAFLDDFLAPRPPRPNDLSASLFEDQLRDTNALLAHLQGIDRSQLSADDGIDWRLAESVLRDRELSRERVQLWRKDPRVYLVGTRVVDVGTLFHKFVGIRPIIGGTGAPAEKAQELLGILRFIPTQLENGKRNLTVFVPRFQELAIAAAEAAFSLFDKDVPAFAETILDRKEEILRADDTARAALASYLDFLRTELPKRPHGEWTVGSTTYDAILKAQGLPYDSETLYKFGWDEFNRYVRQLEQIAERIDPAKTWLQLAAEIKNDSPDPSNIVAAFTEWVGKSKAHVEASGLVPIPWKNRVVVVPSPPYLRGTWGFWPFQFFRAEAPDREGVFVGEFDMDPPEPNWSEERRNEYRREHDWGMVVVMSLHETYPGHFVQGLYQYANSRKLRRTQRVSVFSEGWALYAEHVMRESGFLPNERIELRQLQGVLGRIARLICDVGIHTGKLSYEEAVALLRDRVGFLPRLAQLEVDGSTEAPAGRVGWFVGLSEILKIRDEFKQRMGSQYTLSDFHSRLLKVGNMPPELMREGLMVAVAKRTN